ncbi:MAG: hypothetical protein ABS46_02305 [Cytophagaceae bacterium SCN 52-12]|nr:MAG: hypothetical protein ABS46_02305 [Cytophagaceae bacterium SCN 52-12]
MIAGNSEWSAKGIEAALKDKVYPDARDWLKFIKWSFLALGITLTLSGIVFFFAYNWDYLHKFFKMSLIGAGLAFLVALTVTPRLNRHIRKAALTAASVMVGVLFAVYGQIYQTGANAFDFFLAWALFTAVWVAVSRFPVLWLSYFILLNTTWFLYVGQVAPGRMSGYGLVIAAAFNLCFLAAVHARPRFFDSYRSGPEWLAYCISVASPAIAVISFGNALADPGQWIRLSVASLLIAAFCIFLFNKGMQTRKLFYISLVCVVLLFTGMLLVEKLIEGRNALLIDILFVAGGLYGMVSYLLRLNKSWRNDA